MDSWERLATEEREPFDGRKEKEKTRRKDQDGRRSEKGEGEHLLKKLFISMSLLAGTVYVWILLLVLFLNIRSFLINGF